MDRQELARLLLGQGMLGRTADVKKLYPIWQQEFTSAQETGQDYPQFQQWFDEMNSQAQTSPPAMRSGFMIRGNRGS